MRRLLIALVVVLSGLVVVPSTAQAQTELPGDGLVALAPACNPAGNDAKPAGYGLENPNDPTSLRMMGYRWMICLDLDAGLWCENVGWWMWYPLRDPVPPTFDAGVTYVC